MASIVKEILIDVPAIDVWVAIRNSGEVHLLVPGLLADCRADGHARIVVFRSAGRVARELLVSIDDDRRRLVYGEPDGPFITRNASCQVFTVDRGRSRFVWTQDLLHDELASVVSRNMDMALPDMKRTLESAHANFVRP